MELVLSAKVKRHSAPWLDKARASAKFAKETEALQREAEEALRAQLRPVFDQYDKDHSGSINRAEMKKIVKKAKITNMTDDKITELMKEADADGSGEIEFEELAACLSRQLAAGSEGILTSKVLVIDDASKVAAISYRDQGDATLSTAEAFKERQKLRRHAVVLRELEPWWTAAIATARQRRHEASDLRQEDYVCVFEVIFLDLVDSEDRRGAEAEANSAWKEDSADGIVMSRVHLFDSLFELVDVYATSIEADEYATILRELLARIINPDGTIVSHEAPHDEFHKDKGYRVAFGATTRDDPFGRQEEEYGSSTDWVPLHSSIGAPTKGGGWGSGPPSSVQMERRHSCSSGGSYTGPTSRLSSRGEARDTHPGAWEGEEGHAGSGGAGSLASSGTGGRHGSQGSSRRQSGALSRAASRGASRARSVDTLEEEPFGASFVEDDSTWASHVHVDADASRGAQVDADAYAWASQHEDADASRGAQVSSRGGGAASYAAYTCEPSWGAASWGAASYVDVLHEGVALETSMDGRMDSEGRGTVLGPLGSAWEEERDMVNTRPASGHEITNLQLLLALQEGRKRFTPAEMSRIGLGHVAPGSFILVTDEHGVTRCFRPATARLATGPLGSAWREELSRPATGTELVSAPLRSALGALSREATPHGERRKERIEFTPAECEHLGLRDVVTADSYVRLTSGESDRYFRPATGWVVDDGKAYPPYSLPSLGGSRSVDAAADAHLAGFASRRGLRHVFSFPGFGQQTLQRAIAVAGQHKSRPRRPPLHSPLGPPLKTSKLQPLPTLPASVDAEKAAGMVNTKGDIAWLRRTAATPAATKRVTERLALAHLLKDASSRHMRIAPRQLQGAIDDLLAPPAPRRQRIKLTSIVTRAGPTKTFDIAL